MSYQRYRKNADAVTLGDHDSVTAVRIRLEFFLAEEPFVGAGQNICSVTLGKVKQR
jgi:hypothetical protein